MIFGKNNPIIIKLQGGLGNQMFQYAFGLSQAKKWGCALYFDLSFFKTQQENSDVAYRELELDLFTDQLNIASDKTVKSFLKPNQIQRLCNKLGISQKNIYREEALPYDKKALQITSPAYFEGYWQCESYFKGAESLIREKLTFNKKLNVQSQSLSALLKDQADTVSIHIRRADYVTFKRTKEIHGECSANYYKQAIELLKSKVSNPRFYFFSDDMEWVKENLLNSLQNYHLTEHNQNADSWQDMLLMSQCKHHIIANSSFSWWGAWLNPSKEKIVITPQNWFNNKTAYYDDKDIVPLDWIKLPNE